MTRTARVSAPAKDPVAVAVRALDTLLRAVEACGGSGPAAIAYRVAIRRHGQDLAREGGADAVR